MAKKQHQVIVSLSNKEAQYAVESLLGLQIVSYLEEHEQHDATHDRVIPSKVVDKVVKKVAKIKDALASFPLFGDEGTLVETSNDGMAYFLESVKLPKKAMKHWFDLWARPELDKVIQGELAEQQSSGNAEKEPTSAQLELALDLVRKAGFTVTGPIDEQATKQSKRQAKKKKAK